MQKRMCKRRRAKKPVAVPNMLASIQWGWVLAVFAVVIGCLVLVALATSQSQGSTVDATIRATVTSTFSPMPIGGGVTPGARQTMGVFPLSAGGPIPVPANVLHPTNVARVVVNDVIMSIYAGSMTRSPAIGALAILQENLTTGQQSLHLYQTSQAVGALTILAVHNDMLTFSTPQATGTFNLGTDQFHF